ncbi:hypothetical protein Pint_20509 [Pistacia integerrima]|uniref:Uncharacterized protein n=1 Tax=Pistacia integerrima TaxID=434235 RepID=A0ACC0XCU5_9ROSI|nr:hypothetical protein Pint_20509 [Pistacia integerrima]
MGEEQRVIVPKVKLGSQGFEVSRLGFGCSSLPGVCNDPMPEEAVISLIKHAFEKGVTFFDTADTYGPHTNEILIGKVKAHAPKFSMVWLQLIFMISANIVPTVHYYVFAIGTTKINFNNNIGCVEVKLTKEDLEEISAAIPVEEVAGSRFKNDSFLRYSWKFANTPPKGFVLIN